LETLPYAWGKPKFDMALNVKYDLQKKIVAHLDLFYVGQRYAHFEEYSSFVLPAYFDANIGLEYRYTKRLSAFLNCNNIASKNYQVWAYYPVQRFNAMLGFSYAFWGE
jgi:outer membrane receptor protein involved in Fe transport